MANGEYDKLSDAILPSLFGLSKFTRGEAYYWRTEIEIPASSTSNMPMSANHDYSAGGSMFNPAVTTVTDISGTGTIHTTGTAPTSSANGCWKPIAVGKFIVGDPKVTMGIGDSIMAGVANSGAPSNVGIGYFGAMLYNGGAGNQLAGLNCGVSGGFFQTWSSVTGGVTTIQPELVSLIKYCNVMVDNYGTNNLANTANVSNAICDSYVNYTCAGFADYITRQNTPSGATPLSFYRVKLAPRTNVPPTSGVDDQTVYGPKWDITSGGVLSNSDYLNAAMVTAQTTNSYGVTFTQVSFDSVLRADPTGSDAGGDINASPHYHRWVNGVITCADGTHMNWINWIPCGASLKTAIGL